MIWFLDKLFSRMFNFYSVRKHKVQIGENTQLNGAVFFVSDPGVCNISIGKNCIINSGKIHNVIGGDTRTIIRTINDGSIKIGDNVGISNSSIVARYMVEIKDNVFIGGGCKIYDNDFHPINFLDRISDSESEIASEKIVIDDGAFIGAHSIILKGVNIGKKAVIGAGSVVARDIPDNEIWAGNPARFIRKLDV